ncbi:HNH endonuclease [Brevibacillus borstelensis]|nr:HNH endonuclease [Brevibacillus borstelensis]RNB66392.1 HNH endonuclease [Brevibacillus borstelensis]
MANRPLKPCASVGCSGLTRQRYCDKHQDKEKDNQRYYDRFVRDKRADQFYHSKEWQRVREQVLIRDHYLCQHCLKQKRVTKAEMVHHIHPLREHWHLRLVPSNLISLCNACHNQVHGGKSHG